MPPKKKVKTAKKVTMSHDPSHGHGHGDGRLPVTLLCGFLGAGKTTLLKHILEVKNENSFKCAVIVNDMAELNIDSELVATTAVVENKKVIAMQNGCVCCSLADDLSAQVAKLALEDTYDYVIIEASGVSEPSEIAKLFVKNDEGVGCGHQEAAEAERQNLEELVRLDTLVTVLDAGQFFHNLEDLKCNKQRVENIPRLLVEQIEYSNVIIINKMDLLNASQLQMVQEYVQALNMHAEIVSTTNSVVDVNQCLFTKKYKKENFDTLNFPASESKEEKAEEKPKSAKRTYDSGLSTVELADKGGEKTRHSQRFGIKSFVYKARRPFHLERFRNDFVTKYFVLSQRTPPPEEKEEEGKEEEEEESEDVIAITTSAVEALDGNAGTDTEAFKVLRANFYHLVNNYEAIEQALKDAIHALEGHVAGTNSHDQGHHGHHGEESESADEEEEMAVDEGVDSVQQQQEEAAIKQNNRKQEFGNVIRAKGFCWLASSNDLKWAMSTAGNVATMDVTGQWNALDERAYAVGDSMSREWAKLRTDFQGPFADRRQELVFIGIEMDHYRVQEVLDSCLLTDEEMEFGADGWKALYCITE